MKGGGCDLGVCSIQLGGGFHKIKNITNTNTTSRKSRKNIKKKHTQKRTLNGGCNKGCKMPKLKIIFKDAKIITKK
jgi:hypothetical protein